MATLENLVRWRNEFRQVHETIERDREEFEAWFEETALLEAEIKVESEELRQTVTDIKNDRHQYRELLKQLPNVDDLQGCLTTIGNFLKPPDSVTALKYGSK
jgi:predicted nuclease with TOPRIM domain